MSVNSERFFVERVKHLEPNFVFYDQKPNFLRIQVRINESRWAERTF